MKHKTIQHVYSPTNKLFIIVLIRAVRAREIQQSPPLLRGIEPCQKSLLIFIEFLKHMTTHPSLKKKTFVLALQTKFLMELYWLNALIIICIDSTHGTNQYRFKLISVVPDKQGKG